jgi:hypothetical protein
MRRLLIRIQQGSQYRVVEELGLSRCFWEAEHTGSNPVYPTTLVISSLGLEYHADTVKVAGSNPALPTIRINRVAET